MTRSLFLLLCGWVAGSAGEPADTLYLAGENGLSAREEAFSGDSIHSPLSHSEEIFAADSGTIPAENFLPDSPFAGLSPLPSSREQDKPYTGRFSAGIGLAGLARLDADPLAYHFFLGRMWTYLSRSALRVWGETIADFRGRGLFSLNTGGLFYTHPDATSPYLAFGAGLGFAGGERESTAGFKFSAGAGLLLFRESEWQLEMEMENQWLMGRLEGGFPVALVVRTGILF